MIYICMYVLGVCLPCILNMEEEPSRGGGLTTEIFGLMNVLEGEGDGEEEGEGSVRPSCNNHIV